MEGERKGEGEKGVRRQVKKGRGGRRKGEGALTNSNCYSGTTDYRLCSILSLVLKNDTHTYTCTYVHRFILTLIACGSMNSASPLIYLTPADLKSVL